MACCVTAPSHYLNQCWLISKIQWHSFDGNFTRDKRNSLTRISFKSPRGRWVNGTDHPKCNDIMRSQVSMVIWATGTELEHQSNSSGSIDTNHQSKYFDISDVRILMSFLLRQVAHCLNLLWLVDKWNLRKKVLWNLNQRYSFSKINLKMSSAKCHLLPLFRLQYVSCHI